MPIAESCAACGHSFRGDPIPEAERSEWWGLTHYPTCLGVEVPTVHHGALYWECPRCFHTWHYWHPTHRLYAAAEQHRQHTTIYRSPFL